MPVLTIAFSFSSWVFLVLMMRISFTGYAMACRVPCLKSSASMQDLSYPSSSSCCELSG